MENFVNEIMNYMFEKLFCKKQKPFMILLCPA